MKSPKTYIKDLESGKFLTAEHQCGKFKTIAPFKDSRSNYRTSSWCSTKEESKQYIGLYDGHFPDELDKILQNAKSIEVWSPEFKPMSGKVRVKESTKELFDKFDWCWLPEINNMVGETFEVEDANIRNTEINGCLFPNEALEHADDEEELTEAEKEMIKVLKEKGFNITKK